MKKVLSLVLALTMVLGLAVTAFAAPVFPTDPGTPTVGGAFSLIKYTVLDPDDEEVLSAVEGTGDTATFLGKYIDIRNNQEYTIQYAPAEDAKFGEAGSLEWDDIAVSVKSSNKTYATIKHDTVDQEVTVLFTNTTFAKKDVKVEFTYSADDFESVTEKLTFTINKDVSTGVYTENLAKIDFKKADKAEIKAGKSVTDNEYAEIEEEAFALMLEDEDRSIVVVGSNFKLTFDEDSKNLDQDVDILSKVTEAKDHVKVTMDKSTATGTFKIAVSKAFYDAFYGKDLVVYDADGKATEIKATLKGDYSVNFTAALGEYYVAGKDFKVPASSSTSTSKGNPNTGSNDVVGVAVALAAVSMVAAGAVAFKKVK